MGGVIIAIGFQIFRLYKQHAELRQSTDKLNQSIVEMTDENKRLQADLEYFSHPTNLEKELRSQFNYKSPGENMIIVIPPQN